MGIYDKDEYNEGVVTGFVDDIGLAWHQYGISVDEAVAAGRAFHAEVPAEVAERILGWKPVILGGDDGRGLIMLADDDGNSYTLPDRLSQVVCNPNTGRVVNIAGKGYNPDLHITMREAIQAATDAEAQIASVVCLGDGAHMGMTFRANDNLVLGGDWGGAVPYVGFGSSLTGALASQIDTGTIVRVCDNTCQAAEAGAKKKLRVKRTRFSNQRITASVIREALEISFADTGLYVAQMEAMAQVTATDGQVAQVLELWRPMPEDDGRSKTMVQNSHAALLGELHGPRNPFGVTAAGLLQAHNTWAHWQQTTRGAGDRLERKAVRTMEGHVQVDDAKFMAVLGEVWDEIDLILQLTGADAS